MKKTNTKGRMSRLFGQLFKRRHKDHIPVYLSRFETIDKLIAGGLLAIDLESRYVCIDASLHIQYMDSLKEYTAFFNNLRAYMNFHYGLKQKPMIEPEHRIDFGVMLRQTAMYDQDTGEFYDPPQTKYRTLIVGANQYGKVEYTTYTEPTSNHNNTDDN